MRRARKLLGADGLGIDALRLQGLRERLAALRIGGDRGSEVPGLRVHHYGDVADIRLHCLLRVTHEPHFAVAQPQVVLQIARRAPQLGLCCRCRAAQQRRHYQAQPVCRAHACSLSREIVSDWGSSP